MSAVGSPPLDALPFNPVNLGPLLTVAVNNLWSWLALLAAAAFSFWRLKTVQPDQKPNPNPNPHPIVISEPKPRTTPSPPATTPFGGPMEKEEKGLSVLTRDSSKKYFRVCYDKVEERENEVVSGGGGGGDVDGGDESVEERWPTALTVEMRERGDDLGWYSYQDLTVLDGSVVRLWEVESPLPGRRRCSVRVNGGLLVGFN